MTSLSPPIRETTMRRSRGPLSWATISEGPIQLFDIRESESKVLSNFRRIYRSLDARDSLIFLNDIEDIVNRDLAPKELLNAVGERLERWGTYVEDEADLHSKVVARISGGKRLVPVEDVLPDLDD